MKDLSMLVWLTQLGLSTALPLGGFILLALWLQGRFGLGQWVLWCGIVIGAVCAINGFRNALQSMHRLSSSNQKKGEPPVSFNDHD